MSTADMPESRSLTALAKMEALRLAKHPVFVVGVAATAYFLATLTETTEDYYNIAIVPAFFVGMFSMVAMFRLTRSMEKLEETVGTTPAGIRDRVLALCCASLLPMMVGLVSFVVILVRQEPVGDWAYGAFGAPERGAIFFGEIVIACLGGPLLGIAAARWLRFPGGAVVLCVAVLFVVLLGEGMADAHPQAWWSELLRLASPWTQFSTVNSDDLRVGSWTGSPFMWLGWLAALCVLAVLGALLKGAEGEHRTTLLRVGAVVGGIGLVFLALAMTTGDQDPTLTTPKGVSVLTGGAVGG
jgi:hypothetical protein